MLVPATSPPQPCGAATSPSRGAIAMVAASPLHPRDLGRRRAAPRPARRARDWSKPTPRCSGSCARPSGMDGDAGRRDPAVPPGRGACGARRARERRDPHRGEALRRDDATGSTSRSRPRSRGSPTSAESLLDEQDGALPHALADAPHRARPAARGHVRPRLEAQRDLAVRGRCSIDAHQQQAYAMQQLIATDGEDSPLGRLKRELVARPRTSALVDVRRDVAELSEKIAVDRGGRAGARAHDRQGLPVRGRRSTRA